MSRLLSQSILRRLVSIVAIAFLFASGVSASGPDTTRTAPGSSIGNRHTNATYEVSAGLDGEIYPVFANYASLRRVRERTWGTIAVRVTNSSPEPLRNRITVQIPGWSDREIQLAELSGGESHTFLFAPTFYPRLYQNHEIIAATAVVAIANESGAVVDEQTVPIRLRSADDLYWGRNFEYAPFIASWVTPHDPAVEELLSRAKEFAAGRRLPGYETASLILQERSTLMQARAIYRAVQEHGVSYVKSSLTFGRHEEVSERVRMPAESLHEISANCIDGAVMYASLFENLGMDPEIVLVPGHAYVAVRLAPNSPKYLYIETSLTGRASFSNSVASAQRSLARVPKSEVIRINIRKARLDGIYPMPSAVSPMGKHVLEAGKKPPHSGS
jgi:hypothetical protein